MPSSHILYLRFGSGYTVQFKVSHNAITEQVEPSFPIGSADNSVPLRFLDSVETTKIKEFVADTFPGAVLMEEHQVHGMCVSYTPNLSFFFRKYVLSYALMQSSVTYQISSEVSWSRIFRCIEANKHRFGIVDYSVNQTTLEQVRIHVHYYRHATLRQKNVFC